MNKDPGAKPKPLRVAVAGLGFMGATHIRAWYHVTGAELAAVISTDPLKLSGDLSRTGGNLATDKAKFDFTQVKRYSHLSQALADPAIDAVDLCLPTDLHADSGLTALRAGKHVLLEKPLARTSPEAYALADEAAKSGRILMAGHVLRFFPEWQQLARQIRGASLKLGSFRRNCAWPSWSPWLSDSARSGGAPLDLLIHDADFVLSTFGQPQSISAVGLQDQTSKIDWLSAHCSFRDSGPVEISGGWHASPKYPFSMEFQVLTEHGTLEWNSARSPSPPEAPDPWVSQLQYFTDCATDGVEPALCPPAESAKAVRFVEIMVESRKRQGEPLPWTN